MRCPGSQLLEESISRREWSTSQDLGKGQRWQWLILVEWWNLIHYWNFQRCGFEREWRKQTEVCTTFSKKFATEKQTGQLAGKWDHMKASYSVKNDNMLTCDGNNGGESDTPLTSKWGRRIARSMSLSQKVESSEICKIICLHSLFFLWFTFNMLWTWKLNKLDYSKYN